MSADREASSREASSIRRTGIVLCGGRSSRMGRPKAWLPWCGRTLIEHVVDRVSLAVDEVVVVTSEELDLPPLSARIVRDREPELGPLAGIREGLAAARGDWAFVTSTDTPFVSTDYVRGLLDQERACAPIAEGHVQVLSAVYPVTASANADRLLASGRGRPRDLLDELDGLRIDSVQGLSGRAEEIAAVADAFVSQTPPWLGMNTPAAYLAAVGLVDPDASAEVELLGRAALQHDSELRRVPVGTLGDVLSIFPAQLGIVAEQRVAKSFLVSIAGRALVRDLSVPVGPGERVSVLDAQAGG